METGIVDLSVSYCYITKHPKRELKNTNHYNSKDMEAT